MQQSSNNKDGNQQPTTSSASCDCTNNNQQPCRPRPPSSGKQQEITILYQGDEFRNYLEYHAINYEIQNPSVNIELMELPSTMSSSGSGSSSSSFTTEIITTPSSSTPSDETIMLSEMKTLQWDGSIFPSHLIGGMMETNQLWDLTNYISSSTQQEDNNNWWTDIIPFTRYTQSTFNSQPVTIPLDSDILTVYYRKDLFTKYNLDVPRTWEEYLEVASFFHGKSISEFEESEESSNSNGFIPGTISAGGGGRPVSSNNNNNNNKQQQQQPPPPKIQCMEVVYPSPKIVLMHIGHL